MLGAVDIPALEGMDEVQPRIPHCTIGSYNNCRIVLVFTCQSTQLYAQGRAGRQSTHHTYGWV
jgi:hypothetical protein